MNTTQHAEIRAHLLEERERIIEEWKNHGGDGETAGDWDLRDPEERAVQITSDAVERQIAGDNLNLLRKVDLALRRLEENTYESCERCGAIIPMERLLAKPSVSLCLPCQEAKDAEPD